MPDGFERGSGAMQAALQTPQGGAPQPSGGAARQTGAVGSPQTGSALPPGGAAPPGGGNGFDGLDGLDGGEGLSWKDRVAGQNAQGRRLLDRYADEQAFGRAHFELLRRMSSGELKQANPFPAQASPEEQVNWRKANGVPEVDTAYAEKLAIPNGVVLGEVDKSGIDHFAKQAHGKNWSQDQFNDAVGMWYATQDHIISQRDQQDDYWHEEAQDQLRQEWPAHEYRQNVAKLHNYLNQFPEDFRRDLMGGRTASGRLIGDDPRFLHMFLDMAEAMNPEASVLPSGMTMEGYNARRKELETMVNDVNSNYYTGANAQALRAEYRRYLEGDEKRAARQELRGDR
jgi:hypothetical protein